VAGAVLEHRTRCAGTPSPFSGVIRIDLQNPANRNLVVVVAVALAVFVIASSVGHLQGLPGDRVVAFCGQLCHSVMNPEFVAYQTSPHARVACVKCHIGPGGLVREGKTLRRLPGLRHRREGIPQTDSDPGEEPEARPGNLRGVPLAGAVLRGPQDGESPLPFGRGEHAVADQPDVNIAGSEKSAGWRGSTGTWPSRTASSTSPGTAPARRSPGFRSGTGRVAPWNMAPSSGR